MAQLIATYLVGNTLFNTVYAMSFSPAVTLHGPAVERHQAQVRLFGCRFLAVSKLPVPNLCHSMSLPIPLYLILHPMVNMCVSEGDRQTPIPDPDARSPHTERWV